MDSPAFQEARQALADATPFCLFGLGTLLDETFEQVVKLVGRAPDLVCDNAPGWWGRRYRDIPCVGPEALAGAGPGLTVLVGLKRYESVCRQLSDLGVRHVYVLCFERCLHRVLDIRPPVLPGEGPLQGRIREISGRWAMVTGASRGIGRLLACALAERGANLVLHGRSLGPLEVLAGELSALGVKTLAVAAELRQPSEVNAMLEAVEAHTPGIDLLFNNAAISPFWPQGFPGALMEDFQACFAVNTLAPIRITQRLLPGMIRRGGGRIVNLTSSVKGQPEQMAYACSKAALDRFVADLAPSLEGTGVEISLVDPGWLSTDMGGSAAPNPPASVLPGALLGALLEGRVNGHWFSAQEYAGMTLQEAATKALILYGLNAEGGPGWESGS